MAPYSIDDDADFSPAHPRHYVLTTQEAERFAALMDCPATERFRQDVHIAVSQFVQTLVRPSQPLDKAMRQILDTVSKGKFLALDKLRDDPAGNAVVVGLQSMVPPGTEFSRAPAAMKSIADRVLDELPPAAGGGKSPDLDFCCFIGALCDSAADIGAETSRLGSNEKHSAVEPESGVVAFIRSAIDRAIAVAFKAAEHMPEAQANDVRDRARSYNDTKSRAIVDRIRTSTRCDRGAKCQLRHGSAC